MRKTLLLLACILLAMSANAQVRFGAKVGGTLSNLTMKEDGKKLDAFKAGMAFQIGGVLEYSLSESLSLQPELLYVMCNSKIDNGVMGEMLDDIPEEVDVEIRTEFQFIQLPVNLKYTMGVENLKLYVTAGPYFGYALSAKMKAKVEIEGNSVSASADLFGEEAGFDAKHFDFDVGIGLGVEVSKFTVGAGYQYGIANLTGVKGGTLKFRNS